TSCSTRTSATETLTVPCAIPATHSWLRNAARPCATASYKLSSVTSTVGYAFQIPDGDAAGADGHNEHRISCSLFIRYGGIGARRKMVSIGAASGNSDGAKNEKNFCPPRIAIDKPYGVFACLVHQLGPRASPTLVPSVLTHASQVAYNQ